jgi:hypothetical protein
LIIDHIVGLVVILPRRKIPGVSGKAGLPWLLFIHRLTIAGQNEEVEKVEKGEKENLVGWE